VGRRLYNGARLLGDGPSLDNIERIDMAAMPMTTYFVQRGMQVDLAHFDRMDVELTRDMERITEEVHQLTGHYINIASGDQVADLLHKKLGLKQARPKMTALGKRESVEHEQLVAIQHLHECVGKILEFKEFDKLRGTYVRPMRRLARKTPAGMRMVPNLTISRVPSGRAACKEPNMLAFPSRTKRGRQIKEGFHAADGWSLLSVDESQIEVRIGAHNSEDPGLIHVYETGQDVYSDFAIGAFRLPDKRYEAAPMDWKYPGIDKLEHRQPSKTCFLAALYDVTASGLLEQMPVVCANCGKPTTADKEGMLTHSDMTNCPGFVSLWNEDKCQELLNAKDRKRHHKRALRYGLIWDMWGRVLHVAAVRSVHPWVVSAALREVGNFPYQAGANGTIKLTMGQVMEDLVDAGLTNPDDPFDPSSLVHPVLYVHDEILFEVHDSVREDVAQLVVERFETCCDLKVPIKAGAAHSRTWGSIPK
jgi:DNA polymerase I